MAVSLEVRSPFLDQDLAAYVNALPRHHKLHGATRKYLLRRLMRDNMPEDLIKRPKKGFGLPLARWFRHELKPLLTSTLAPSRVAQGGLLDPVAVDRLVKEHLSGHSDHRKELWSLLCLEAWRERYLHGDRPTTPASDMTDAPCAPATPVGPPRPSTYATAPMKDGTSWAASPSRHRCNDSI